MATKKLTEQSIIDGLLSRIRLPRELGVAEYACVADDDNDWIEISFKNGERWKLTVEPIKKRLDESQRSMGEILKDMEEAVKLMRNAPPGDGEMIRDDLVEILTLLTELAKLLCQ